MAEEDQLSGQLRQLTKYSGTEYEWLTFIKHGVTKYRISLHCYESKLTGRRPKPNHSIKNGFMPHELTEFPLSVTGRKLAKSIS